MNNRHTQLEYLIQQCKYSGSYVQMSNTNVDYLLQGVLGKVQKCYPNFEVNTKLYTEQSGRQNKVVYFRFQVLVPFKGSAYNINSQIVFPPLFPIVPPIFSVINNDDNKFQVHQFYFNYLLPDGTYEAKLQNAAMWVGSFPNFQSLFMEFCQVMGIYFPFFSTNTPLKNNNLPPYYHPFYNDPNVKKPFDYPNQNQMNRVQPMVQQLNLNPQNTMMKSNQMSTPSYVQQTTQPQTQFTQGTYNQQNYNRPSPQALKEALVVLKTEMDKEAKQLYENIDFLMKKKVELVSEEAQIMNKQTEIDTSISAAVKQEEELKTMIERSKFLDADKIENFIEFGSEKDEGILRLASELKGIQETEMFLENVYMESNQSDVEAIVMKLNSLWRKEFDKGLALKVLNHN